MNEEPNSEKRLVAILNLQKQLSEERDKLIFEIHAILDRIIVDGPVALLNKEPRNTDPVKKEPTFIAEINDITGNMRIANESIKQAYNRLNELI
jgi:hypothetical protein